MEPSSVGRSVVSSAALSVEARTIGVSTIIQVAAFSSYLDFGSDSRLVFIGIRARQVNVFITIEYYPFMPFVPLYSALREAALTHTVAYPGPIKFLSPLTYTNSKTSQQEKRDKQTTGTSLTNCQ